MIKITVNDLFEHIEWSDDGRYINYDGIMTHGIPRFISDKYPDCKVCLEKEIDTNWYECRNEEKPHAARIEYYLFESVAEYNQWRNLSEITEDIYRLRRAPFGEITRELNSLINKAEKFLEEVDDGDKES